MNSLSYSVCLRCSLRLFANGTKISGSLNNLPSRLLAVPVIASSQICYSTSTGDKIKAITPTLDDKAKKSAIVVPPSSQHAVILSVMPTTGDLQNNNGNGEHVEINNQTSTSKPRPRKKLSANPNERHTANVFMTPERAYNEYLLATSDLAGLWNTKRRSPFDGRPDIVVYLRVDVEKRAVEVWGSLAKLEQEKQRRRETRGQQSDDLSLALRTAMRSYSDLIDSGEDNQLNKLIQQEQEKQEQLEKLQKNGDRPHETSEKPVRWLFSSRKEEGDMNESDRAQRQQVKGSGRVVWAAIAVNAANFGMKLFAYLHTGSSAMFAETVHSLADTLNQAILAFGLHQSTRRPDQIHPYGWYNFSYVSSLISGVGIFFVGAGLSWFHGIQALLHPDELESVSWALVVLMGSFISEGASLMVGVRQIRREAAQAKLSFLEYVRRGYDPSVNVVLAEDCVAVFGVGVAGSCLWLSHIYSSHIPDAVGSLIIGTLLGGVASLIIYTNAVILVGKSIPEARRDLIRQELEADRVIRAVHDIKATEMGGRRVRFKAEVDIDGRELTRVYLDRIDLDLLLGELQKCKTTEDLEAFMLRHGEGIIDLIGAEIDRVEKNLKTKYPEVRHVDLEVL